MEFRKWIGAVAVAGIALAPSAAMAQTAKAKVDDSALKSQIETRLSNSASLKGDDIKVAVVDGIVTLSGTVHSIAQSTTAKRLAKVTGVTRVESTLDIDPKPTVGDKTAATTGKVVDKTVDVSKKVAGKTKDVAVETGDNITDAWITTKIKADFVNEDPLKGSDINVDTNNHVITLKGTVTSEAGRTRALQIAKTTKGVSRVIDKLTIAPAK